MKLNIYKGKYVEKTYKAETYDLMFGTVEDVANAVNLDALETGTNAEVIKLVFGLISSSMDLVKDLLKDIFDGLTDEEIKRTRVADIAAVLVEVVNYTLAQLNKGITGKN